MADFAYEDHPIANLFPLITDHGLEAMTEDIREHGLRVPIVLAPDESDDGKRKVCDGRNRYRACIAAGVTPRFEDWDGKGSLIDFVVSLNKVRRHLNKSQWAVVGADIAAAKSTEIKATQQTGEGFSNTRKTKRSPRNAQKEAAETVGVSSAYVGAARAIGKASPETLDAVRKGEKTIPEAQRELGLDKPKRAKRKPKTESTNGPVGKSKVNDELVDDPPDIAKRRRQGKIAPNAIPEVDDPGEDTTSPLDAINEDIDERQAIQADLSDADWLESLPLSSKLEGVPLRTFQCEAIIYRNWEREIKARRVQGKEIWNQIKRKGPFAHRMQRGSDIDPPEKWLRCPKTEDGGCAGEGRLKFGEGEDTKDAGQCTKCSGRGYWIK